MLWHIKVNKINKSWTQSHVLDCCCCFVSFLKTTAALTSPDSKYCFPQQLYCRNISSPSLLKLRLRLLDLTSLYVLHRFTGEEHNTFNTVKGVIFFLDLIFCFVLLHSGEPSQLDLDSMVVPGLSSFSSDEAAMAVIMSLLETDVNMGQSGELEDLHWPF